MIIKLFSSFSPQKVNLVMDLKSPPPHQQKYAHLEDEGLQVAEFTAPEVVKHEQPGLQVFHSPTPSASGKEPFVIASTKLPPPIEPTSNPKPTKRKKWLILGGVIAAIVIIIAAVVGGVVGSRKSSSGDDEPPSKVEPTTNSTSSPATRQASTRGAYNGTGMAICYAHHEGFWGFLFYQDWTGTIQAAQHTRPQDYDIGIRATYPVNVEAANSSALAAGRYNFNGKDTFHLIYVNRQNILSDAWMEDSTMDDKGNFNTKTPWTSGNLSDLNFHVATDNRVGMHMAINQQFFGKSYNDWGAKLVVGGADGALHQLSFDWPSKSWDSNIYKFENSYAYSGVKIRVSNAETVANFNTTVYSASNDGTLQYRVQSSTHPNNDTLWPTGGIWQSPVSSNTKAAVNSSVSVSWDTDGILFPNPEGKLGRLSLDLTANPQFGTYNSKYETTAVMPGSETTFDSLNGYQLMFYQPNGSSIAFQVYDLSANLKKGGVLVT